MKIDLPYLSASTKTILNKNGVNSWDDLHVHSDDRGNIVTMLVSPDKDILNLDGIGDKRKKEIISAYKKSKSFSMASGEPPEIPNYLPEYKISWYENYIEKSINGDIDDIKMLVHDLKKGDGISVTIERVE